MGRAVVAGSLFLFVLGSAGTAFALEQPNGAQVPSDMGCDGGEPTGLAAELACICDSPGTCNIGAPCAGPGDCPPIPSGNCESTLWHSFNDNTCIPSNLSGIDPWTDGSVTPETFTPTCPLTFTVVTRGTAKFRDVFGWYNVTGSEPAISDLHPMLDCNAGAGAETVLDVRSDPAYAGGEVGFFLATPESHSQSGECAGGDCCADLGRIFAGEGRVFYSQRSFNADANGSESFIHLVIFDSAITPRKFYFAWEDIFGGSNNDFTDIVTSVTGVECSGGGQSCDTGFDGVCSHGITSCAADAIDCVQLYESTDELCDGADNDCDGDVDEDGVCTDDVVANCEDVVCPAGQVCRRGGCVDVCKHVECPSGKTCRGGVCFPGCNQCNGIVCTTGESCDLDTGHCLSGDEPDVDAGIAGGDGGIGGGGGGCGCRTSSTTGGATALLMAVALLVLRRRRR